MSFNYESRFVSLNCTLWGHFFFLYTHLTPIGLCPLGRSVISQVSFFSIAFISSSIVAFHFGSQTAFSNEIVLTLARDIPGAPYRLSHKDLEDLETLDFLVQFQLHLSFPNWSPPLSFLRSRLHHLELGVSPRLPQLTALPIGSSNPSELLHLAQHLY
jgi:hypothetical protein